MNEEFKAAALELYRARTEQEATKSALRDYRGKEGSCLFQGETHPEGHRELGPCFYESAEDDATHKWCSVCIGAQPLWKSKRKAASRAGAALRSILALAKKENAS